MFVRRKNRPWKIQRFLGTVWMASCFALLIPSAAESQDATSNAERSANLEIFLKGPDEKPLRHLAVVSLMKGEGECYKEETTSEGHVRLKNVVPSEYSLQIVAPGFSTKTEPIAIKDSKDMKLTVQLESGSSRIKGGQGGGSKVVAKTQNELGKATEAIRSNNMSEAQLALEKADKIAPQNPEVQYVLGVFEQRRGSSEKAKNHWSNTLESDPQHYRALMAMGETLLRENHAAEAIPYIERSVKAVPNAWRPHALYAEACLKQGLAEEAIQQARLAQELGHEKTAVVQPILAAALSKQGNTEEAKSILQEYVKGHPADEHAKKQLATLQAPLTLSLEPEPVPSVSEGIVDLLPSSWMPPDIDENVGTLEPGAVCDLGEVQRHVAERIEEFLKNVDRFTATESLQHESINKWGQASLPINRVFNYVVEVKELRPSYFSVYEYRSSPHGANEYADGVATNGVPAMILIFHPHNTVNFEMTCEGRVHLGNGEAWQVYFRQRPDRPNTIRSFRIGENGQNYPIALKGRALIAADTFQVVRLETQMIAPIREINLEADYTAIEYGQVHFDAANTNLWLPQIAEVYSARAGRRIHQSHTFSNYALFSVDEKQKIADPKVKSEKSEESKDGPTKPN